SASTVDTFEIGGNAHGWAVQVSEEQILGVQPDVGLTRSEGEIRGKSLNVPVVVGFHNDQGAGIYRRAPFEIFVVHTPTGLEVTGIFAATVSDFEISPARINGQIGICAYDLRWNGKVYAGYRGCGEKVEAISLSLPATLAKWSDVEVAGALGFLLNLGGPIRMDPLADNSARYRNAPVPDPTLAAYYEMAADARTGLRSLPGDKPHDWRREFLSSGATWEAPGMPAGQR
ncbi:MAG: hypothetical protein ACXWLG_13040, partial [Myxococcaceae bacterium]